MNCSAGWPGQFMDEMNGGLPCSFEWVGYGWGPALCREWIPLQQLSLPPLHHSCPFSLSAPAKKGNQSLSLSSISLFYWRQLKGNEAIGVGLEWAAGRQTYNQPPRPHSQREWKSGQQSPIHSTPLPSFQRNKITFISFWIQQFLWKELVNERRNVL